MLSFSRRCRESGISVHLMDIRPQGHKSRHVPFWIHAEREALARTHIGTEAGLEQVRRFVTSAEADGVISADELTLCWLARRRDVFEPRCRVMAPPADVLDRLLSKSVQAEIAADAGFDVLPTWHIRNTADPWNIPEQEFPICVRPTYPNSVGPGFKVKVLAGRNELMSWLASLHTMDRPLIAQPFRFGPNVIVHGARALSGELLALTAYRTARKYQGLAQSIERIVMPDDLEDCCRRFIGMSGTVGPFHFDLLESAAERRTYFLEMNIRMGGSTAKVIGLGHDEPGLTIEAFGMAALLQPTVIREGRRRVTSKRSLVKQILDGLRNKDAGQLNYPLESRSATFLHALRELALVSDPSLSLRDPEGSALYLFRREGQS
jgi:hypothetical protein